MPDHVRDHYDTLMTLLQYTDDPDIAGDLLAELADIDRLASTDPTLFEELYTEADL